MTDEERKTMKAKRETLATLVQITTKTLELKKLIAKSMADKDSVDFGYVDLVLAYTNICDALKLIDKTRDFLYVAKKNEETKMKRSMNRDEALSARKALCNAESYISTIRESLWNDPEFDDVEKTLEDLEQVRSVVKRICDAIPATFKEVKKPVSELVLGENGEVSIRCFDPEKEYCREGTLEEYEAMKDDDAKFPEETPATKKKLDAITTLQEMIDALFKVKFKIEENRELADDVLMRLGVVNFEFSRFVKSVLEETK